MKKILSLILIVITVLSFGACGNKPESGSDTGNGGTGTTSVAQNTPKTVMDMFDGERKVWFYLIDDSIKYNSEIYAIIITTNGKTDAIYYDPAISPSNSPLLDYNGYRQANSGSEFKFVKRCLLSDFKGMSNQEIINHIKPIYEDASQQYLLELLINSQEYIYEYTQPDVFPSDIKYTGSLGSSGNVLYSQCLVFGNALRPIMFQETVLPTTILDKEYVGLRDGRGFLITQNTFDNFGELELDSPEGAYEFY